MADADNAPPRRMRRTWLLRASLSVAVLVGGMLGAGLLPPSRAVPATEDPVVAPDLPVTAMNERVGAANNSPELAADPTNGRFVVMANRLDAPDFSCALQVSGDGGRTWLPADPVPRLPEGADKCYAPEVAFDSDGTLYYLFVGLAGGGNQPMGTFLTSSDDRGRTFTDPTSVLGPRNYSVRMSLDPTLGEYGRLHLAWIATTSDPPLGGFGPPPNPIMYAHSDDGGRSWSDPVQVSDADRPRVVAPALAVGPDHAVHVAYYDLQDDAVDYRGLEGPTWEGTWSLVVASSYDGGRDFGHGTVVDDAIEPHERVLLIFTMPPPALATDAEGRVCTAWTDARFGDADALARCSPDGGVTWQEPIRLNDDPTGNGAIQYQPQLASSPGGRIDAVFYDRRDDASDASEGDREGFNHVYYTYSTDGGRTYEPNVRLTSTPSFSGVGQRYTITSAQGRAEWGSRMGLLSVDNRAVAVWTDTRNQRQGTAQDLFTTTVTFPRPARSSVAWRVLGGTTVVVGVALGALLRFRRRRVRAESGPARGLAVTAHREERD